MFWHMTFGSNLNNPFASSIKANVSAVTVSWSSASIVPTMFPFEMFSLIDAWSLWNVDEAFRSVICSDVGDSLTS